MNSFTNNDYTVFNIASEAILDLCNESSENEGDFEKDFQCRQANYLRQNVTQFIVQRNSLTYLTMLQSLFTTIVEYNPWSVVLELVGRFANPNIVEDLISLDIQQVIRGGVPANLTAKFDLVEWQVAKQAADALNERLGFTGFDEILIVSDGTAGSMGAMVPFLAYQLSQNGAVSTEIKLVSYGGTASRSDASVASFPASVQGVHLEDPLIGLLGLFLYV